MLNVPGNKVLVVDDNDINRKVLTMTLKKVFGVEDGIFLNARNGKEAVDLFTEHRPEVVFMDCMMPVMDGYEATVKIRELEKGVGGQECLIIAVTADITNNPHKSLQSGMNDCILKPCSPEKLQKSLHGMKGHPIFFLRDSAMPCS